MKNEIKNYMETHNGYTADVLEPCLEIATVYDKSKRSEIIQQFDLAALMIQAIDASENKLTIKELLTGPIAAFCAEKTQDPPTYSYFTRCVCLLRGDKKLNGRIMELVKADMVKSALINSLASYVTLGRDGKVTVKPEIENHLSRLEMAVKGQPVEKKEIRQVVELQIEKEKATAAVEKETAETTEQITEMLGNESTSDEDKADLANTLAIIEKSKQAKIADKLAGKKVKKPSYTVKAETAKKAMAQTGASDITSAVEMLLK